MIFNPFARDHIDDEELSCFIDGTCSEAHRVRIIKHLKSCTQCSECYREAVMYKGLWMSDASDFVASEESISFARQALDAGKMRGAGQADPGPMRSLTFPARYFRWIAAAACIVILVAIGIFYHSVNREEIQVLDQSHIEPIQEAMELASMNGSLVFPGGERLIGSVSEVYRSGYVSISDSLRTSLAYFAAEFQNDGNSHGVVYWLLGGYIATGQVTVAREVASRAIEEFPMDIDIMIFDGIISYMDDDVAASERRFRQVLEREPDNPYARLNLAALMSEQGDELGALEQLERVMNEHAGTAFAARARNLSEEIRKAVGKNL
jgi:tetratricopeptide (TPR) repeat protein